MTMIHSLPPWFFSKIRVEGNDITVRSRYPHAGEARIKNELEPQRESERKGLRGTFLAGIVETIHKMLSVKSNIT